ncbi:flagellin [Salinibacter ruber]|uniref:flagellin n=1 Tax=Salinibacter ruber TaxID=146919 RepID=UPI0021674E2F|nr:flagellin [Salinibacter ruber]MCS4195237.1 flagellin [Salinibacter ruber]
MSSAFRINTNIQSQEALLNLQNTNEELATRQERLTTGLRINSAEDDAAGFEIANQLEAKTGAQQQAARNIGDAKSMLSTAEGALDSQLDILQTMKEKATQAANDSLGKSERQAIQSELDSLTAEIKDIANNTSFNGKNLIDNSNELEFQTGTGKNDTFKLSNGIAKAQTDNLGIAKGTKKGSFKKDLTKDAGRKNAIKVIDDAIGTLTGELSDLGATQNRLSFKKENLETATKNLSAAQSRIEDADFAREQTQVAKLQVQQQSGTAQLAQANASGQSVLSLLGG